MRPYGTDDLSFSLLYSFRVWNFVRSPSSDDDNPLSGHNIESSDLFQKFAQEIFSMVLICLLHMVRDIGGTTTQIDGEITNSNITKLQKVFTGNGLGSSYDALNCIVPPFHFLGKLPVYKAKPDTVGTSDQGISVA
ncbi:hypothetical protein BJX61DRAFT_542165 [Aspergillus egyptiacus]|nr:hypothetical protein BJX61DRAFT_542165 [Aspergillus egyptiacus]